MTPETLAGHVVTRSRAATQRVAAVLARRLVPGSVLALEGDLGAGKTTFVQGLVAALPGGAQVRVQSPTFALARTYPTTPPVHHLDLYRLDDESAAYDLGLVEFWEDREALCCIEWPSCAAAALPASLIQLRFLGATRRRRIEFQIPRDRVVDGPTLLPELRMAAASPRVSPKSEWAFETKG